KLRRPKSDEEQARQIAQQLEQLAQQEDELSAALMPSPSASPSSAPGSSPPAGATQADKPTKEKLEDRQIDVAAEAREIEKALNKLAKATDLAKERMAAAAKQDETAAEAIGRGALEEAKEAVAGARDQFRELAGQVRALLAQEQAERITAAQRMAADLARQQQQLADQLAMQPQSSGAGEEPRDSSNPMSGAGKQPAKEDKSLRGLGGRARNFSEQAKTLVDVLTAASKPQTPSDQKSADEVARIM